MQKRGGSGRPRGRTCTSRTLDDPDQIAAAGIGSTLMTKTALTALTALLALVAGVSVWMLAAPSAEARTSALPDVHHEAPATDAGSPEETCPHVLERTTRQIGSAAYRHSHGGYSRVYPYAEDIWRDCNGQAVNSRRTYWAESAPPNIVNPYSGGCGGLKTIINEILDQRTDANGRTEYLWRYTERNDCGGHVRGQQWTICGPIQSVSPEILQRGRSGNRAVYQVRVTYGRTCGTLPQIIVNDFWTSTVPATVPAP